MRIAGFLLAPLAAAAAAGCGSPARLTEAQEFYVGRGVAANVILQSQGLVVDEEGVEKYVNQVGQSLALESDRPETFRGYHFGIVRSETVNAFAAPGGFVFVTTAALKAMQNEDELAGVLAHEIAHVNLRHPEEHANNATQKQGVMNLLSKGGEAVDIGAGAASIIAGRMGNPAAGQAIQRTKETLLMLVKAYGSVIDDFLEEVLVNGYGRDAELAADALAVDLVLRLKYDPGALKAFIGRLKPGERGAWTSHPDLGDRVQKIDELIRGRGVPASIDPARTERFRAAVAKLP